eukprot:s15_g16.t1
MQVWAAADALSLLKENKEGKNDSTWKLRTITTQLCVVLVLPRGLVFPLCAAAPWSENPAQCLNRFLEGDGAVSFSILEDLTSHDFAADLTVAADQIRASAAGRKPSLPQSSAYPILQEIQLKACRKAESQKRQADEVQNATWKIFKDGMGTDFIVEPPPAGQARDSSLVKAARILEEHDDRSHRFQALTLVATSRASLAEARRHKVLHLVYSLHNDVETPLPLRSPTGKLIAAWKAEKVESRKSDA